VDWYKKWFSTPEYLELYSHRDSNDARLIASFVYRLLKLPENSKVLDLACGNGRHSVYFARQGYRVTGVDLSRFLINEAKKKLKSDYSQYAANLDFRIKDMRRLDYKNRFDLVVNLFSSFGYFTSDSENWKVIKNISASLKSGGHFFFDYLNSDFLRKHLVTYDVRKRNRNTMIQVREIKDNSVIKNIIIIRNKPGAGGHEVLRFKEKIKLYTLDDFEKVFDANGLRILKLFGDYHGGRFRKNSSGRLIILAQKQKQ
jgi:SAM-dependent methyltransferase